MFTTVGMLIGAVTWKSFEICFPFHFALGIALRACARENFFSPPRDFANLLTRGKFLTGGFWVLVTILHKSPHRHFVPPIKELPWTETL